MKKILKIILLIIMIISLINIGIWYKENNKSKELVTKAKEYINESDTITIDPKIKEVNEDIIGWLKVDNTNIDYPVVQGKDNDYYLKHNLDKKYSSAGWIFLDSGNNLDDQNLVIYGHHRRDGSMFGSLDKVFDKGGKIHLTIGDKTMDYSIFSSYKIEKDFDYRDRNYKDFEGKINSLKDLSTKNYKIILKNKSQMITLSTCYKDNRYRIVVHGIK